MELGKFENRRVFHTATSRQTVIRDTIIRQVDPPKIEEIKEEPVIEPTIEIKMSGEPSLDEVIKETPKPKRRIRSKKK